MNDLEFAVLDDEKSDKMLEKIKDIIADYAGISKEDITPDTLFFADLNMDSMEILGMICKIEEEFGTELPTEEIKNIYSVGDLQKFLEERNLQVPGSR